MTADLAALTDDIQGILGDDGTRFTDDTCTAALREALKTFNEKAPLHSRTTIDVVASQYEYDLDDSAFDGLLAITSVHKVVTNGANIPLAYDPFFEAAVPGIRLQTPLSSGSITIGFDVPHTIKDLDSATESTIPAHFDSVLVDGGAYHALLIRIAGQAEAIKLDRDSMSYYINLSVAFKIAFDAGLILAELQRPPRDEPDRSAWTLDTAGDY